MERMGCEVANCVALRPLQVRKGRVAGRIRVAGCEHLTQRVPHSLDSAALPTRAGELGGVQVGGPKVSGNSRRYWKRNSDASP